MAETPPPLMNDLAFLSNCLKYDADRLNDRWLYREWISAAESFVLPLVFIIPLLIALCYMMKSGNSGGAELCAALAGAWCTGLTFLYLWAKRSRRAFLVTLQLHSAVFTLV